MATYNNWTDDSALWQVKNGTPGTAQTLAAWDYIESRLAGCDQALANARVDETKEDEMNVSDKRTASLHDAIEAGRSLNEPGEFNPEYVRGQVNLICLLFGLLPEDEWHELVTNALSHRIPAEELYAEISVTLED